MANPPPVGTIAEHSDGRQVRFDGQRWVQIRAANPRARRSGNNMSSRDEMTVNALREQAAAARETSRVYERARAANQRLNSGPTRGRLLETAIEDPNGGILDSLGALVIGGPLRLTGAISQQDVDDYQMMRGLQSENVLTRQIEQRGPQTDSDAARMMLTEISPGRTREGNREVIDQGQFRARRAQARAAYYAQWAARFNGLNGTRNSRGQTVDDAWNQYGDAFTQRMFSRQQGGQQRGRVTIRRVN